MFRGAGWNVLKVIWGGEWDKLLEKDTTGSTEIAPSDSGSSISPSPKYAQTVRLSVCLISR
jgi:hypothetical protein